MLQKLPMGFVAALEAVLNVYATDGLESVLGICGIKVSCLKYLNNANITHVSARSITFFRKLSIFT